MNGRSAPPLPLPPIPASAADLDTSFGLAPQDAGALPSGVAVPVAIARYADPAVDKTGAGSGARSSQLAIEEFRTRSAAERFAREEDHPIARVLSAPLRTVGQSGST